MLEAYHVLLWPRTKLPAMTHASNTLGMILPVAEMTRIASHRMPNVHRSGLT
jgi:cysteine desulfurase / selenocysteine lyase